MTEEFPKPIVTVDVVPLTLSAGRLCLLRARRERRPYRGRPALIGGFVHLGEDANLGATARRVLREKAGLADLYVEQLSTFSGASRDPRGWSVSVAYFSLSPASELDSALSCNGVEMVPVKDAGGMPFDHDQILAAALARLRGKGAYSDLPARLLPRDFTLADLHAAYETALGSFLNADAFRRKVMDRGFVEPTGNTRRSPGAMRPSLLYRLKDEYAVFDRRV